MLNNIEDVMSNTTDNNSEIAYIVCGFNLANKFIDGNKIISSTNLEDEYYIVNKEEDSRLKVVVWKGLGSTVELVKKVAERKGMYRFELSESRVFDLYDKGDVIAIEEVDNYFFNLALGIHNIQSIYEPKVIIIDGELTEREDFLKAIYTKIDFLIKMGAECKARPIIKRIPNKKKSNKILDLYKCIQL